MPEFNTLYNRVMWIIILIQGSFCRFIWRRFSERLECTIPEGPIRAHGNWSQSIATMRKDKRMRKRRWSDSDGMFTVVQSLVYFFLIFYVYLIYILFVFVQPFGPWKLIPSWKRHKTQHNRYENGYFVILSNMHDFFCFKRRVWDHFEVNTIICMTLVFVLS